MFEIAPECAVKTLSTSRRRRRRRCRRRWCFADGGDSATSGGVEAAAAASAMRHILRVMLLVLESPFCGQPGQPFRVHITSYIVKHYYPHTRVHATHARKHARTHIKFHSANNRFGGRSAAASRKQFVFFNSTDRRCRCDAILWLSYHVFFLGQNM